jgi:predicted RNA-binding protein with TRAM domain
MWAFEYMSEEGIRNISMKNKPHINQVLKLPVDRFGTEGDLIFVRNNFIIILKSDKKVIVRVNEFVKIRITKVLPTFALAVLAYK